MLKNLQVNLTFDLDFDPISKKIFQKWTPHPGQPLKRGITRPSMSSRSKVEHLPKFKMAETAILNYDKCSRLHKVQPS